MKLLLVVILCIWTNLSFGQADKTFPIYSLEEALKIRKDSVFGIDLSRQKLSSLPSQLFDFKELRYLNLSKNKFNRINDSLSLLSHLEIIDFSVNKFEAFPAVIFQLIQLKEILISRNQIEKIPEEIKYCAALQILDLNDNPVGDIGSGLLTLKNLKLLDLQGVMYGPTLHKQIMESLPNTKVRLDPPCTCME